MATDIQLIIGAPVLVGPGMTITLKQVTVPQTGATTAHVSISQMRTTAQADATGTIKAIAETTTAIALLNQSMDSLRNVVSQIKSGQEDTKRTVDEFIKNQTTSTMNIPGDDPVIPDEQISLKSIDERLDAIDTALRLLLDE